MPSSDPPTIAEPLGVDAQAPEQIKSQPQSKGNGDPTTPTKAPEIVAPVGEKKLTNAELKAKQKAEKAAKRAQAKAGQQTSIPVVSITPTPQTPTQTAPAQNPEAPKAWQAQQKKGVAETRNLPVRGTQKPTVPVPVPVVVKKEDKTVEFFRHLYKPRTTTIAGANKDVHPAILALGLQMSNYTICGSCARLVATLQAFKRVSGSY